MDYRFELGDNREQGHRNYYYYYYMHPGGGIDAQSAVESPNPLRDKSKDKEGHFSFLPSTHRQYSAMMEHTVSSVSHRRQLYHTHTEGKGFVD